MYNEDEAALRACLRSVFAQSRRVDRIRVVDDGSTDRVSGTPITYDAVRAVFFAEAGKRGIEATWDRTENRGKRWMRGTTVRHLWWLRYMPVTGIVFWATVAEYTHLVLSALIAGTVMVHGIRQDHLAAIAATAVLIGALMQYLMALRLFTIRRSDDTRLYSLLLYLSAPLVALWRLLVLRPLYIYAVFTCRRIDRWGTRGTIEVRADPAPAS